MVTGDRTLWTGFLSLLLFLPASLPAGSLFDSSEVLDVRIAGPFNSLIKHKDRRKESPFVLTAKDVDHNVYIRVRGKSRARICDFPPLRLNFKTKEAAGTLFAGHDKLKLVTHCQNYDRAETDLLQEYVAYRVLNVITDTSYRVRLLRVNYSDTDKRPGKKAANRHGFLLEPAAAFAARIGAKRHQTKTIKRGTLDLDYAALVFVYQFLIGNTDWSLVLAEGVDDCCHNVDVYIGDTGVLLVPYDLDLSGVVNARYAYPDRSLRIRRVTQRLYRGMCMERDVLQAALKHVKSLRAEILAVPAAVLTEKPKVAKETREYLEKFFTVADDEAKLLDSFESRCIKPRFRRVE